MVALWMLLEGFGSTLSAVRLARSAPMPGVPPSNWSATCALPPAGRLVMAHTKLLDAWLCKKPLPQETEAIETFGGNKQASSALLPGLGPALVTTRSHEAVSPVGTNRLDEEITSSRSPGAAV